VETRAAGEELAHLRRRLTSRVEGIYGMGRTKLIDREYAGRKKRHGQEEKLLGRAKGEVRRASIETSGGK